MLSSWAPRMTAEAVVDVPAILAMIDCWVQECENLVTVTPVLPDAIYLLIQLLALNPVAAL